MDWSNERFVKVYIRDTADWLSLSWDAQALWLQLLRKADRSGAIALGRRGPRALASLLGQTALWESRIKPALDELLEDGCLCLEGEQVVLRNFVAAQEATASGAARTAKWREQKRAQAAELVTPGTVAVTSGDETSPPADGSSPPGDAVTGPGDAAGRAVTTRLDKTRLEEIKEQKDGTSAAAEAPEAPAPVARGAEGQPPPEKPSRTQAEERLVFEHWRKARGKRADVVFSPQRRAKIRARLAEGFTVERLCRAIDGVSLDPWDERAQHDDLDVILRDAGQVEKFLAFAERGPPGPPRTPRPTAAADPQAAQRAEARARADREAERTEKLIAQYAPQQHPEARP